MQGTSGWLLTLSGGLANLLKYSTQANTSSFSGNSISSNNYVQLGASQQLPLTYTVPAANFVLGKAPHICTTDPDTGEDMEIAILSVPWMEDD